MSGGALHFDVQGGAVLVLARGASVAALLSLMGSLLFAWWVLPRAITRVDGDTADGAQRQVTRVALGSGIAALVMLGAWTVAQSADMASASTVGDVISALPDVLSGTLFGHLIACQVAAVVASLTLLVVSGPGWTSTAALVTSTAAVLLQAGHSHAVAMGSALLGTTDALHLLAAAGWLGALVPLFVVVRRAALPVALGAARHFTPLGKLCVLLIAATAIVQGYVLVGSVPGLIGTGYGIMAMIKTALFGALFVFACLNRYRLAPALMGTEPDRARSTLAQSLAWQTATGLAVVGAAAILSQLEPAMHVQPWWPFADQPSLAPLREDPDILHEVVRALLVVGLAMLLLIGGLVVRRFRLAAAGLLIAAVAWATPHLGVVLVPAYPTSFYRSPTDFSAASIEVGAHLFAANCTGCHGAAGGGDGPLARTLATPPADLTAAHLRMHEDGELFWWLGHGIEGPESGLVLPAFGAKLNPDERWAVIDYIRAHNAGVAASGGDEWPRSVRAPGINVVCEGRAATLADQRGRFVRLVLTGTAPAQVTSVSISCVAADPAAEAAYAIVGGLAPETVRETEFLIDGEGWLRAMHRRGDPDAWDDKAALTALVAHLRALPVAAMSSDMPMTMPAGMKM